MSATKTRPSPRPRLVWGDKQVGKFLSPLGLSKYQDAMVRSLVESVREYERRLFEAAAQNEETE